MTPLLWYFPLIVFLGVCDVIRPASEEKSVKRIPQAAHGTLEISSREKVV
jgi:hypothetical protein